MADALVTLVYLAAFIGGWALLDYLDRLNRR